MSDLYPDFIFSNNIDSCSSTAVAHFHWNGFPSGQPITCFTLISRLPSICYNTPFTYKQSLPVWFNPPALPILCCMGVFTSLASCLLGGRGRVFLPLSPWSHLSSCAVGCLAIQGALTACGLHFSSRLSCVYTPHNVSGSCAGSIIVLKDACPSTLPSPWRSPLPGHRCVILTASLCLLPEPLLLQLSLCLEASLLPW